MEQLKEYRKLYFEEFGEPLPMFELKHMSINELIELIIDCLDKGKLVEEVIKLDHKNKIY